MNKEDRTLIDITERAEKLGILAKDKLSLKMDLFYTNEEIPLDFERLLNADNFNFSHDIVGIQNNLNRKTLKMDNLFLPRFAKPSK
ncbi:DUF6874 family protein [Bacillus pumilus]|uniref:DUF6874 family protein n=1 Tax=Bacillus pumilus TaxID=1408 RepID=UPI0011A2D1DC|nr:hypothetical protein [Bacillus pumilus]